MKAFTSPPTHHGIFAQVVMRTPAVHVSMPYRVHEIFKILLDTESPTRSPNCLDATCTRRS